MKSLASFRLQRLDIRDCPAAPVLSSMKIMPVANKGAIISGMVLDEDPGGCLVYLAGASQPTLAQPDVTGYFEQEVQMNIVGDVIGQVLDPENLLSEQNGIAYTNQKPVIVDFEAEPIGQNHWELSGYVRDEFPIGLTVRFTSPNVPEAHELEAVVDSEHYFHLVINRKSANMVGTVYANTSDWWATRADTAYALVSD